VRIVFSVTEVGQASVQPRTAEIPALCHCLMGRALFLARRISLVKLANEAVYHL
jgi:hypothetical protein